MNTIIGWILRWSGFGKIWDKLDGWKTYGTALLGILAALTGLLGEIAPLLSAHDTTGILGFLTHIAADTYFQALLASFALLGLGHKLEKNSTPTV